MNVEHFKPHKRVDVFKFEFKSVTTFKFILFSDIHYDNPHCDRKAFYQVIRDNPDAFILMNGDTFCAMQGKYDKRASKSDIRTEHLSGNYLDLLVETTANDFKGHPILFIGKGNHETSIQQRHETNLTRRLVQKINGLNGNSLCMEGGYNGWIVLHFSKNGQNIRTYKIWYHHGWGGGGPVTKGLIDFNRVSNYVQGADMIWLGHVHQLYDVTNPVERLNANYEPVKLNVEHLRTGTFKEEFFESNEGYHIEKGRPPKPIGCYVLHLKTQRIMGLKVKLEKVAV